jgi:hypothetical protein
LRLKFTRGIGYGKEPYTLPGDDLGTASGGHGAYFEVSHIGNYGKRGCHSDVTACETLHVHQAPKAAKILSNPFRMKDIASKKSKPI